MSDWEGLQSQLNDVIREWRKANPTATFTEIEDEVDEKLATVKRQMVEDLVHESKTADLTNLSESERPQCPTCDEPVIANGKKKRTLKTGYEKEIELERHQAYCPTCKVTFFPSGQ